MVEVSLTVGKLDASLALLLTRDHHLIEFPTILLPNGVKSGSIVKIRCDRDFETEKEESKQFQSIQDEILTTFGMNLPQSPLLKVKNVTQTSCVLEWDPLDLGTATLKNLVLFKDGKKLGSIPQPLTNRTTKLSGLPIDKTFKFQLRLDTTAGMFSSDTIEVKTHKMTDLSGITVCLGDITPNEQFTVEDIQATLKNMGAHYPAQDKLKVDTTHFITTRENKQNPEYLKANEMNIPIIRPEWVKACERERRIVGVRDFYVKDCALPDILAKNYWQKAPAVQEQPSTSEAALGTNGEEVLPEKTTEATEEIRIEAVPAELAEANEPEVEEAVSGVDIEGISKREVKQEIENLPADSLQVDADVEVSATSEESAKGELQPEEPEKEEEQKESETNHKADKDENVDLGSSSAAEIENADLPALSHPTEASQSEDLNPPEAQDNLVSVVQDELKVPPITAAAAAAATVAEVEEVDISAPKDNESATPFTKQEVQDKVQEVTEEVKDYAQKEVSEHASESAAADDETITEGIVDDDDDDVEAEDEIEKEEAAEETGEGKSPTTQKKKKNKKKKSKK